MLQYHPRIRNRQISEINKIQKKEAFELVILPRLKIYS